ncbi:MAG: hypothetical protein ACKD6N_03585 [Candidatus Bathyarchaeota archaeon]
MVKAKKVFLEDYRRKTVKIVNTPNGLTVKVRVLTDSIPFLELSRKHGLEKPYELETLELAKRVRELMKELFQEYVLEPKIPSEIGFDEIFEEDRAVIFQAIVEKLSFFRQPAFGNPVKPEKDI